MDLKKCKIGHFYDGDKYPECPHCKNNVSERSSKTSEKKKTTEKKTTSMTQSLVDIEEQRQEREIKNSRRPIEDLDSNPVENKEVIEKKNSRRNDLGQVVGWLVGISGSEYGHSHELYATSNTIGITPDNIIAIEDASLCNSNHCIICFDINSLNFFIDYENSGGKIKVNDYRVSENIYINYMDVIEIGGSNYTLIPLCKDGFSWWGDNQTKGSYVQATSQPAGDYAQQINQSSNYTSEYYGESQYKPKFQPAIEEIVYQPDNNYVEESNDMAQQELTGILISSPWRCPDCNALNSMMFNKCRTCGKSK